MRYEKVRQFKLLLQSLQQIEYLRAHGDIKCGHRFVENDKFWIDRQSARYCDTLSLSTTKLVRIAVNVLSTQANDAQQFSRFLANLTTGANIVDMHWFGDQRADSVARIQRSIRVLKHHLHATAYLPQFLPSKFRHVCISKDDLTASGFIELHDEAANGGP